MYVSYRDNIFAVFENDNDNARMSFLEVLNDQHKNISYTIEKSKNTLQVLYVVVQVNDKSIETWSGENRLIPYRSILKF